MRIAVANFNYGLCKLTLERFGRILARYRREQTEVIEAAPNLWLIYYGSDGYFDWPEADVQLAIYEGKLEDLKPIGAETTAANAEK